MSQKDRNDLPEKSGNKQGTLILALSITVIILLIVSTTAIVTLIYLNKNIILGQANPTPTPTPTPISDPTPSPTETPIQPSPTPTATPTSTPTPTNTPQLENKTKSITPPKGEIKNNELPGYFPDKGFKAPPSDLSKFKKVNSLLKDMVISGNNIDFVQGKILVRGQLYSPVFLLRGARNEQRVGFELPGSQKALFLQFGQQDLTAGDTNLTYQIRLLVDGKLLWAGECRYGKNQQIISVPLDIPGAKSLVIEYAVTEQGGFPNYNIPPLYFTKAELLED